jgi:hypothetical protein
MKFSLISFIMLGCMWTVNCQDCGVHFDKMNQLEGQNHDLKNQIIICTQENNRLKNVLREVHQKTRV